MELNSVNDGGTTFPTLNVIFPSMFTGLPLVVNMVKYPDDVDGIQNDTSAVEVNDMVLATRLTPIG